MRPRDLRARLLAIHTMNGAAIRELRGRFNLSQAMLAEYVGMSVGTVTKWEGDEKNRTARRLEF